MFSAAVVLRKILLLKKKQDDYSYSFELKANNLVLNLKDNQIEACDKNTNEIIFVIPAPYMYDAKGISSDSVTYSLEQKENKYTFLQLRLTLNG